MGEKAAATGPLIIMNAEENFIVLLFGRVTAATEWRYRRQSAADTGGRMVAKLRRGQWRGRREDDGALAFRLSSSSAEEWEWTDNRFPKSCFWREHGLCLSSNNGVRHRWVLFGQCFSLTNPRLLDERRRLQAMRKQGRAEEWLKGSIG